MTNVNTSCGLPSNVRLAQQQLRHATVVLHELLLARLRGRNRCDRVRAIVVVRAFAGLDHDGVVAVEPRATDFLLELQAIVLQIQQ
jgi:hypothetical protein